MIPSTPPFIITILEWTPIRALVNSHSAVMLFFVLSGFVLSIPFLNGTNGTYFSYLIRRILRIYVPYLVAIIVAIFCSQMLSTGAIKELGESFKTLWAVEPNARLILEHVLLLGNIHSNIFNGVIWSLIHEFRISLIFPLVVLAVQRLDWKINIFICFALTFLGGLNNVFHFQSPNGFQTTYFDTLRYLSLFIIGALLAKYRFQLINQYNKQSLILKCGLIVLSFALYTYSDAFVSGIINVITHSNQDLTIISEYGMALGSCGFIIIASGSVRIADLLKKQPILFFGKISYSLYLYHVIVLASFIHLFTNTLPLWSILVFTVAASIFISALSWKYIEVPCIQLGRRMTNRFKDSRRKEKVIQESV